MQYVIFILQAAVDDFKRNKTRTFLTSMGILIGVMSVVLLLAFGLGLRAFIKNQFESLGTNIIMAVPGELLGSGGGFNRGGTFGGINFDEKDVNAIRKIKKTQYVFPVYMKTISISVGGEIEIGTLYATTEEIFIARNLELDLGRYFEKTDVEKRSKNVVLGPKIAQKLFGSSNDAIGKVVKIEKQAFPVIGVLKPKGGGGFGGPDLDSFVYMPYKTAYAFNPNKTFYAVGVRVTHEADILEVKQEMKSILLRYYDSDEFSVVEQTEILNAVSSIFAILNTVLAAIAAISLLVGGIGIMNIMYVSVIERTREIGIRRALGATRKDVLLQFLTEAVLLSLFGGLSGLALSFIAVFIIQRFFPAYIDTLSVITALGVCSTIGIVFGVIPARRASHLSPVEAIRYE